MSVFRNSFDSFDDFGIAPAGGLAFDPVEDQLVGPHFDDSVYEDPFDYGADVGIDPLQGPLDTDSFAGAMDGLETHGSPADRWLGGHEFSGSMSHGTIDPTGGGNDVFCVDGHVLSLPT